MLSKWHLEWAMLNCKKFAEYFAKCNGELLIGQDNWTTTQTNVRLDYTTDLYIQIRELSFKIYQNNGDFKNMDSRW